MNHTDTPSKRSLLRTVLGLLVMSLCVFSILFNGSPQLNKEQAQARLAALSKWLENASQGRPVQTSISYEKVIMHGIAFDKSALLKSFAVDVVRQLWQGNKRFTLSADQAKLRLDPVDKNAVLLSISGMMHLISGSELWATITPSSPVQYTAYTRTNEEAEEVHHSIAIGGDWQFESVAHSGETQKSSAQLSFKTPIQVNISQAGAREMASEIASGFVHLVAGENTWKIGHAAAHFSSMISSPQVVETKGVITLENVILQNKDITTLPLLATFAFHVSEKLAVNGGVESTELEIDRGIISFNDVKIAVNGKLNFDIDDIIPYGEIVFEFNNVSDFINSSWVKPDSREKDIAMVDQIFDADTKVRKQAIINLRRTKGGEWQVGKTSLEALKKQGLQDIFITNGLFE